MGRNTISQLDLVMLGRRGLTARLGSVETTMQRLVTGGGAPSGEVQAIGLRPNLLTNSSFEFFNRNGTLPNDWTGSSAALSIGSGGADGTNTVLLTGTGAGYGGYIQQTAAGGATFLQHSGVVSVAAKTSHANQKIHINVTGNGVSLGPIMRIDTNGTVLQTDDLPADGYWYRFYRPFITSGSGTAQTTIQENSSITAGSIEIDAVKFEKEDGVHTWLEPSAYVSADWGAATHIRNLSAENIVTGTLVVGGSASNNPRISVKDGSDTEIVTIGQPTGGYYGVEIKGAAGLRISGSGSAEITGGGSLLVSGGNVQVTGTGKLFAGTAGAARTEMTAGGLASYNASNVLLGSISSVNGEWTITADALNVSGTLSLEALTITGALTLSQDLTIGANILRVASSTSNVGINRVPDAQFDLDVNGNFRAGGYIVGKHALQLKGAKMICHYDGPAPFEQNFTGQATGHLGQAATVYGGVIYRPGKFGKGIQFAEATTNLVLNPSFEVDLASWGGAGGVSSRDTTRSVYGSACMKLDVTSGTTTYTGAGGVTLNGYVYQNVGPITVNNGETITASVWVQPNVSGRLLIEQIGGGWKATTSFTPSTNWQLVYVSWTNNTGSAVGNIAPLIGLSSIGVIYIDAVQVEKKAYRTPYCDGSLGAGHTWASTAHNSTSTRAAPYISYPYSGNIDPKKGTITFWYTHDGNGQPTYIDYVRDNGGAAGAVAIEGDIASGTLRMYIHNGSGYQYASKSFTPVSGQTYFIVGTWDSASGAQIYVDLVAGTAYSGTWTPVAAPASLLTVGSDASATRQPNGAIDDLVILDRVLTTTEMRAIYESDAPVFAETGTWGWRTPNNLAWADGEGLWAIRTDALAAFGVSGVDGKSWGMKTLDKGDLLIGHDANYILWDASATTLTISGKTVFGAGKGWLDGSGISLLGKRVDSGGSYLPDQELARSMCWYDEITPTNRIVSVAAWQSTIGAPNDRNWFDIRVWGNSNRAGVFAVDAYRNGNGSYSQFRIDADGITFIPASGSPGATYIAGDVQVGNLYVGLNATRYFRDDGTYTRFSTNFVVDGDLYCNGQWIGTKLGYLNQSVTTTADVTHNSINVGNVNANGAGSIFGNAATNYGDNWSHNIRCDSYDYGSIAFHDAGNRVDVIRVGAGIITLGYNGGWGSATVGIPNNTGIGMGNGASDFYRLVTRGQDATSSYHAFLAQNSNQSNLLYLRNDGYSWVNQNWAVGSDEKLKDKVRVSDRGLEDLMKLKPRRYERKVNGREEHGFVAQELQVAFPELVSTAVVADDLEGGTPTEMLAIDYTSLIPVLVKAVQELAAEVATLKAKAA